MIIKLQLDYNGSPYLELKSDQDDTIEDQTLERFIREGLAKGIIIKNEADMDTRDDFASIRFKN